MTPQPHIRQSKRCGCPDCSPGAYDCPNTDLRDERVRYREALRDVALHHDISDGALGFLWRAIDA